MEIEWICNFVKNKHFAPTLRYCAQALKYWSDEQHLLGERRSQIARALTVACFVAENEQARGQHISQKTDTFYFRKSCLAETQPHFVKASERQPGYRRIRTILMNQIYKFWCNMMSPVFRRNHSECTAHLKEKDRFGYMPPNTAINHR